MCSLECVLCNVLCTIIPLSVYKSLSLSVCLLTVCAHVALYLSQNFGVSNIGLGKRVTLIRNALGRTSGTVVYVGLHTSIVGLLLSLSSMVGLLLSLFLLQ